MTPRRTNDDEIELRKINIEQAFDCGHGRQDRQP
jgi:hypothetical protein